MFKKGIAVGLILSLLCAFCACGQKTEYYEKTGFAMGSAVSVRIYGSQKPATVAANVIAAVNETDKLLSTNLEDSDIYKLNQSRTGCAVSRDTFDILSDCLSICNTTGKVLDITVGAVSELWGFDTEKPSLPDEIALQEALPTIDMQQLLLNEDSLTVAKAEGQKIDLGAFGKGIACMRALPSLRGELAPAIVSVGGTVLLYGNHPDADAWTIGVRDPKRTANDYCAMLHLTVAERDDTLVVSTSGNYEKTFTQDGKTYHHILDTATGKPVENDIVGVTVISAGGLVSDALSTVLYIHGLSEQTKMVLDAYRVQAVFLTADGRCVITDGLQDKITLTDNTWRLCTLSDVLGDAQ